MPATAPDALYRLLPAIHRIRDGAQGEPLRALLSIIQGEFDRLDADIAGLYDNWFIETCDEWVVPYIGDLLRVRPLHPVESAGVTTRAYVANTLAYRRRKGTAVVLEQLARDTTGWPARAVEFFARLITTQHMNHVRLSPTAAPEIRDAEAAELTGSPFDRFGHTLDVRRIAPGRGMYNIPNVGIFLWRLQSYAIGRPDQQGAPTDFATARERPFGPPAAPLGVCYTFHPAGVDAPLFNDPQTEEAITHLAEEQNVPGPLRRLALGEELEALRRAAEASPPEQAKGLRFMTDEAPGLRVFLQHTAGSPRVEVPRERMYVCDIPDGVENASPPIDAIAIDPERGRLRLSHAAAVHRVFVTSSYGFPGDLGGGPYDRTGSIDPVFEHPHFQRGVSHLQAPIAGQIVSSLRLAIDEWHLEPPGRTGVIAIMDSLTEQDAIAPALLSVNVPSGSRLLIVAADWPAPRLPGRIEPVDVRPHYIGDLIAGGATGAGERGRLVINGLMLEGSLFVESSELGALEIVHTTIVPQGPFTAGGELLIEPGNEDLQLSLSRSIVGPIRVLGPITKLSLTDCLVVAGERMSPDVIVDAPEADVSIERTTIFGGVHARVLEASNVIFDAPAIARQRQKGCVRFSYVPAGSRTPRRHRCQPDHAIAMRLAAARAAADAAGTTVSAAETAALAEVERRRVTPAFASRRYGDPELGQLRTRCGPEIRRGADNGSEMGAYCFLQQPHREANLRTALDEYLRFGLEAGVFFVSVPRRGEAV